MTRTPSAALPFILAWSLALPAAAGRYETDHDADADFESYRTFAWREVEAETDEERVARSDLVVKRARSAVFGSLKSKGLRESDAGAADLLVELRVLVRSRVDVDDLQRGWHARDVYVSTGRHGTAVLDLIDRRSGALVWRGWAHALIRDGRTDEDRIRRGMEKLLRDYPPGGD